MTNDNLSPQKPDIKGAVPEQNVPTQGTVFAPPQESVSPPLPPQPTPPQKTSPPAPPTPVSVSMSIANSGGSQPPPPPPLRPPGPSFDIFAAIPFIIGGLILIGVIFAAIKLVPNLFKKASTEPVTISYWGLWEEPTVMGAVLSDFEKEHPDIKVDYRKWDVKQYRETLSSRVQQGIGPDVFRFHNSWLPMFKDLLVPLPKDTINPEEVQTLYPKVVSQDLQLQGALYGIPLSLDTLALFVNTETLGAAGVSPPKTWDELQKIAPTLTVIDEFGKIKTSGVAMGAFDNVNHATDIISLMVFQNNGKFYDANPESSSLKNAQDAICFYIGYAKNNNPECSRGDGFVWDDTQEMAIVSFARGDAAMYFGYSWDILTIKALNPTLSFQVAPVPQLPNQNLNIASYWVEGVSKKSKHQKEALELLKFLSKKETVQKLYAEETKTRLFGGLYARTDLAETLKSDPMLSVFLEQAKTAVSTPFASDTYDNGLNQELNTYLGDMIRSALGNTSVSTAFEQFYNGVSATYTKYGIQ